MKKWDYYDDYLKSDEWKKIKADFYKESLRANGICFLCYNKDNLHLHHWRYPKNWNYDSYENLIELCSSCHQTAHNIEHDKMLHNSYMFATSGDDSLVQYLSWMIKATKVMEIIELEQLSDEF